MKSQGMPDYLIVRIDSLRGELNKAIEAARVTHAILSGLQLPSFVKTDGQSGFHIYVPLDAKSSFETSKGAAAYICKLIRLKVPELVTLEGSDDHSYGKLTLDYSLNEPGVPIVAPYSLVTGESPMVAAPLSWEEVKHGLQLEDFNFETIFKRLKQEGDPFENIFKKKVNADTLLERLELNYAFLFN